MVSSIYSIYFVYPEAELTIHLVCCNRADANADEAHSRVWRLLLWPVAAWSVVT